MSTILNNGMRLVGPKRHSLSWPIKPTGPFQGTFKFSLTHIQIYFKGQPTLDKDIQEYREQILAACPNKTGGVHFLEKGIEESHERLLKKAEKLINCSHAGMVCLKGCPRAKETQRPVIKDVELSNVMALLNGKVLYEVTSTMNKSVFKYERELAKLMVPNRRSPSGPVKGTKSVQPPNKKKFQHSAPKTQIPGKSKNSRKVKKFKTVSKKTEFVTSSIPNPILLLAAYSKNKKSIDIITTTTPNIPTTTSNTTVAKSNNSTTNQHPTMPSFKRVAIELDFAKPPRRKTGWKPFGPGLHGGAPPKACLDSHDDKVMQEPGQQDISDSKGRHEFKGIFILSDTRQ